MPGEPPADSLRAMSTPSEAPAAAGSPAARGILAPLLIAVTGAAAAASTFSAGAPWNLVAPILIGAGALAAGLLLVPALMVAMIPALMPTPQFARVFAHEVALFLAAAAVILAGFCGQRHRLWRLDRLELLVAVLLLWGIFTFFWVRDPWWYTFAIRKVGIGLIALWTARRLARWVSGENFRLGIVAGVLVIGGVTTLKAYSEGAIDAVGYVSRRDVTDIGWGTSNYIAAILALMVPIGLYVGVYDRRWVVRLLGWASVLLSTVVAGIAASRGGALLLVVTITLYLLRGRIKRRAVLALAALAMIASGLLATPAGVRFVERFTDPKELSSIVVRLVVWREGWNRLVDHFPWGMGFGQGYGFTDRLATEDPHNYWLVVGSELGVPGLLLWAGALLATWMAIRRLSRDPATKDQASTLRFTFVIAQVNCLFEPTFSGLHYLFLYFWIVGFSLGVAERSSDQAAGRNNPSAA